MAAEREGVRIGQEVRDVDDTPLGRVARLFDWGFQVRRGFWLFHRDQVIRYDELRGVRGGVLVVSRSSRDLFELAAGGIPDSWRIPTPPAFPSAATPGEAAFLREDIATGAVPGGRGDGAAAAPPRAPSPFTREDELAAERTRGQVNVPPPQPLP